VNRTTLLTFHTLVTSFAVLLLAGCSSSTPTPTPIPLPATDSETAERGVETGVEGLDRVIHIVLDRDMNALRSQIQYTEAECTFEDGLGGPPKCKEGEVEGETVEVLPFLGSEGNFVRKDEIDSWIGIDASDLYAVYSVSDSAFSDPIYPSGEYAIAFINEARFVITTLQIVEGNIVRVDSHLGNPPEIRLDDVDVYLIPPLELDQ